MGVGLVLLPTLALAVLARGVYEADRQARAHARRAQAQRLQLRTAELASTLARHPELFEREPAERFELSIDQPTLAGDVEVDGSCDGWRLADAPDTRACDSLLQRYDRPQLLDRDSGVYDARDFSFAFAAARQDAYLHLFVRVVDDQLAPRGRRLDEADHLRLIAALPEAAGSSVPRRYVVSLGAAGDVTTYQVDRRWRREVDAQQRDTWGDYRTSIRRRPYGKWRAVADGYELELRLPLRTLGPAWREAELGLAVVDVDVRPELERGFSRQAMWIAPRVEGAVTLMAATADRFRAGLDALGIATGERRFGVFDARGRELFSQGLAPEEPVAPAGEPGALPTWREAAAAAVEAARLGSTSLAATTDSAFATSRVETKDGELLGVVIEADTETAPSPAFARVLLELPTTAAVIAAALLLLFLLLGYTRRLSARLLRLIDDVGADRDADDEIGELSRRLTELVERDRAHRGYLEQLPRVLGHETLGPLGVVKMAIAELPADDPRRDSAQRAIGSIEELVEDLREATSLEEALRRGERIHVDLVAFLHEYAAAYRDANDVRLELDVPDTELRAQIIERRLEQLLDKLLDNAAAFAAGGTLTLSLRAERDAFKLRVTNPGSQLPPGVSNEQLFAPMSSWRRRTSHRHLGLGLYVARLIAEQHGGGIEAWNADADHVVFEVTLRRDSR